MEFNKWYDYWFEHKGHCPECGKYMTMSTGCLSRNRCSFSKKAAKKDEWVRKSINRFFLSIYRKNKLKEKLDADRKRKNLDTSEKKHYSKVDD
jgi:hypothetical protein